MNSVIQTLNVSIKQLSVTAAEALFTDDHFQLESSLRGQLHSATVEQECVEECVFRHGSGSTLGSTAHLSNNGRVPLF